jgi:phytoene dehydrogenase-like protein
MAPLLESLATEPMPPQPEPPPRMRASDADREAAVRALLDALARGLLTLQEGDERVAAAYVARFRDELPPLTADLPAPEPAPVAPGWRILGLLAWLQLRLAVGDLWRRSRGVVRSRPRLVVATVALLALLWLVAGMAVGGVDDDGYGGESWNHSQYDDD